MEITEWVMGGVGEWMEWSGVFRGTYISCCVGPKILVGAHPPKTVRDYDAYHSNIQTYLYEHTNLIAFLP
jgi:hypothetical protein